MAVFRTRLKQLMLEKAARDGEPLTQAQVARATGLSMPTVSRWYGGEVDRLEAGTVGSLLTFFDVELNQLVEFSAD